MSGFHEDSFSACQEDMVKEKLTADSLFQSLLAVLSAIGLDQCVLETDDRLISDIVREHMQLFTRIPTPEQRDAVARGIEIKELKNTIRNAIWILEGDRTDTAIEHLRNYLNGKMEAFQ